MTNSYKHRRGLSDSGMCPLCNQEDETLIHMTRDCAAVTQAWLILAGIKLPTDFFSLNPYNWLVHNLNDKNLQHEWKIIFGDAVSCFWQTRNEKVFHDKASSTRQICARIM